MNEVVDKSQHQAFINHSDVNKFASHCRQGLLLKVMGDISSYPYLLSKHEGILSAIDANETGVISYLIGRGADISALNGLILNHAAMSTPKVLDLCLEALVNQLEGQREVIRSRINKMFIAAAEAGKLDNMKRIVSMDIGVMSAETLKRALLESMRQERESVFEFILSMGCQIDVSHMNAAAERCLPKMYEEMRRRFPNMQADKKVVNKIISKAESLFGSKHYEQWATMCAVIERNHSFKS